VTRARSIGRLAHLRRTGVREAHAAAAGRAPRWTDRLEMPATNAY
jgi:hypothetical protein